MCFEFEALYWAKLAEEEDKRKQAEKQQAKPEQSKQPKQPAYDEDPLPV